MRALDQALLAYGKSQAYPFHMPGHKRRFPLSLDPNLMDITEIAGFDDLHDASGMIADIERDLAELYGVEEARLLLGGSTLGNLVSLLAHLKPGDSLLMARNCHKSIYHGAILGRLSVEYVYPRVLSNGLQGPIEAASVQEALCAAEEVGRKVKLVAITSPSYEGVVSDLSAIARVAHAHEALLLVDAAHGAHFGFHPYFPPSMADQGADLLVTSLHKTMPFYTMTAALLLPHGSGADRERVSDMIDYLETSSPSYILMGQAAAALRFLRREGEAYFQANARDLKDFYRACESLRALEILRTDDPGKIVISCARTNLTGQDLMEWLRKDYQLELEMASFDYVLAMTSLMDTSEGLQRLQRALLEIDGILRETGAMPENLQDKTLGEQSGGDRVDSIGKDDSAGKSDSADRVDGTGKDDSAGKSDSADGVDDAGKDNSAGENDSADGIDGAGKNDSADGVDGAGKDDSAAENDSVGRVDGAIDYGIVYGPRRKLLEPWQALEEKWEDLELEACAGRVSRDSILLYPPGIPLVHSGEEITECVILYLKRALKDGLKVQGLREGKARVLREELGSEMKNPGS